jgi:hypothetical protein
MRAESTRLHVRGGRGERSFVWLREGEFLPYSIFGILFLVFVIANNLCDELRVLLLIFFGHTLRFEHALPLKR